MITTCYCLIDGPIIKRQCVIDNVPCSFKMDSEKKKKRKLFLLIDFRRNGRDRHYNNTQRQEMLTICDREFENRKKAPGWRVHIIILTNDYRDIWIMEDAWE